MAYDLDTLMPLHKLTKQGEETYKMILEREADKIIFRSRHPLKYFIEKVSEMFG